MTRLSISLLSFLFLLGTPIPGGAGNSAEIIHWWISGSESAALQVIREAYEARGNQWVDIPVKASYQAKTAALSRFFSGSPPTVVQWHVGVTINDLHQEGILRSIQDLADAEGWKEILPELIWDYIAVDGRMVVVPVTLHASNWIWGNRKLLDDLSLTMPATWNDFLTVAPKIKTSGVIPLALGGQPWQETLLFLNIVLAVGGPDLYRSAMVNNEPDALTGPEMTASFDLFGKLRPFVDSGSPGRSWDETTRLVISGDAAFQVMGDWAKGEFLKAGKVCGSDFTCALAPGTQGSYVVVSDAFAMIAVSESGAVKAQKELAEVLMDKDVQRRFNLIKGSIPPRLDIPVDEFDPCAQMALKNVREGGVLLPGLNMAKKTAVASAILDTVSTFWNTPGSDPGNAALKLRQAIEEATF